MPIVTKSEYARMRSCSAANISKYVKSGRLEGAIVTDDDGKDKIDSEKADKILGSVIDTAKKRGAGMVFDGDSQKEEQPDAPAINSYDEIRRRQAEIKLEEQQLDLEERKGGLLYRSEVERSFSAIGQQIREHLQTRNRDIADKAATMTDPWKIKTMLDESDRAILDALTDEISRKYFSGSEQGDQQDTTH